MSTHFAITNLSISFGSNTYIENFSTHIQSPARIAIIGRNGSGKSSLLNAIASMERTDMRLAYLRQSIDVTNAKSHGECIISRVADFIRMDPDILLLDEPTNHLDKNNRQYLLRMLDEFKGVLIFVSHDPQMLNKCADEIWHIRDGMVQIRKCGYNDYIKQQERLHESLEHHLTHLHKQKKFMHKALMKEQERSAKSRRNGQKNIDNKKWPTVRSKAKFGRGNTTAVSKRSEIDKKLDNLNGMIDEIEIVKSIKPTFHLVYNGNKDDIILSINGGACGYKDNIILEDVYLAVRANSRIAIEGANGSGKSTLLKAIVSDQSVNRDGDWYMRNGLNIGFLDQSYSNLNDDSNTVFDVIYNVAQHWSHNQIREHLNSFLFQKNDEVNKLIANLSGGERARLSLAKIAAKSPALLVLDEITNNIDLETKMCVIEALNKYNGAIIVVSHDDDFIGSININEIISV